MTTDVTLEDIMTRVNAGRKGSLAGQWLGHGVCALVNTWYDLCVQKAKGKSGLDRILCPFAGHRAG